ncbi:MAG: hypothetical protein PHN72_03130 [Bacilli bacterium]|nr:hypothetical protein [Bacilli bacterium]
MNSYCSDCKFLNTNDAKCDGIYKCSKSKQYTKACTNGCQSFEKNYGLNAYEKEKLYDLGKKASFDTDNTSIFGNIVVIILLIIAIIVTKVMGL